MVTRAAAILAALLLPCASAWAGCVTQEERAAKMVRHMQTQLMVGALQCRGSRDLGQREIYNRVVTVHNAELTRYGEILISHFRRGHGPDARSALDSQVTGMANRVSAKSRSVADFCTAVARFGESLLRPSTVDLAAAAGRTPIPYSPDEPCCPAETVAAGMR
mgnify:CR=1 FL=1